MHIDNILPQVFAWCLSAFLVLSQKLWDFAQLVCGFRGTQGKTIGNGSARKSSPSGWDTETGEMKARTLVPVVCGMRETLVSSSS